MKLPASLWLILPSPSVSAARAPALHRPLPPAARALLPRAPAVPVGAQGSGAAEPRPGRAPAAAAAVGGGGARRRGHATTGRRAVGRPCVPAGRGRLELR